MDEAQPYFDRPAIDLKVSPLNWRGPAPKAHESIWNVLHKLVYLNNLRPSELRALVAPRSAPSSAILQHPRPIIWMNWCDVDRLRALLPASTGTWPFWFGERELMSGSFVDAKRRAQELRYCASCMRRGFHSALFQLPELAGCPDHDEPLRQGCPSCRLGLLYTGVWRWTNPFACECGHVLWPARNLVEAWYPARGEGRRLDTLARRFAQACRTPAMDTQTGFEPGRRASGVPLEPGHPEIIVTVLRRYSRFLICAKLFTRTRIDVAAALDYAPDLHRTTDVDVFGEALREVQSGLPSHHACMIHDETVEEIFDGSLDPSACPVSNALRLCRANWRTPSVIARVLRTMEEGGASLLQNLHERGAVTSAHCVGGPLMWVLARHIGLRVLINHFLRYLRVCAQAHWSSQVSYQPEPFPVPVDAPEPAGVMHLPPLLAVPVGHTSQFLDVWQWSALSLRRADRIACRKGGTSRLQEWERHLTAALAIDDGYFGPCKSNTDL